jgi:hypothetical protein
MGKPSFKDVDRGLNTILAGLRKNVQVSATVGVQGEKGQEVREEGLTNAYLASIHEFGTRSKQIPERSFVRSTFDANQGKYKTKLDRIAALMLSGKKPSGGGTAEGQLLLLGEEFRADIIKKIFSNIPPPLRPRTIAEKGGNALALKRTGAMINALSVAMERGPHAVSEE